MSKDSSSRPPASAGEARFETRLERLRKIVEELEAGELPLERAIERYEEGVGVLKQCADTLARARARVEQLSRDAEGALRLDPALDLEPPSGGSARASSSADRMDDRD